MSGVPRHIDPELDQAVEKLEELGDFSTKRKASKRAGQILNRALDDFADTVRQETQKEVELSDGKPEKGISYELLGLE